MDALRALDVHLVHNPDNGIQECTQQLVFSGYARECAVSTTAIPEAWDDLESGGPNMVLIYPTLLLPDF